MTTDIIPIDTRDQMVPSKPTPAPIGVIPYDITEVARLSAMVAASRMFGIRSPEDAGVIIMTGLELDLPPMTALRSIHVVEGKPVLSSDLMAALVHKSGLCEHLTVVEMTGVRCTVATKRVGKAEKEQTFSYTREQAEDANLMGKKNWKHHTHQMLKARAMVITCRAVYPDVVMGLYTRDELEPGSEEPAPAPVRAELEPLAPTFEDIKDVLRAKHVSEEHERLYMDYVCSRYNAQRPEQLPARAIREQLEDLVGMDAMRCNKAVKERIEQAGLSSEAPAEEATAAPVKKRALYKDTLNFMYDGGVTTDDADAYVALKLGEYGVTEWVALTLEQAYAIKRHVTGHHGPVSIKRAVELRLNEPRKALTVEVEDAEVVDEHGHNDPEELGYTEGNHAKARERQAEGEDKPLYGGDEIAWKEANKAYRVVMAGITGLRSEDLAAFEDYVERHWKVDSFRLVTPQQIHTVIDLLELESNEEGEDGAASPRAEYVLARINMKKGGDQ